MHVFMYDGTILWAEHVEFSSDCKTLIIDEDKCVPVNEVVRIVNCT